MKTRQDLIEEGRQVTVTMLKEAFSTNEYSGPMGGPSFQQASDLPPFTVPSLKTPLQRKTADALQDKPKEEAKSTPSVAGPGALLALGGLNLGSVKPGLTNMMGYQDIHHGTSKETAAKIRTEGLDPQKGGASHGASSAVASPRFLENSKGHVHVATGSMTARFYANLAENSAEAKKKGLSFGMNDIGNSLVNGAKGEVLSGALPYGDFADKFAPDPDSNGFRSTSRVAPSAFTTKLKDVAQHARRDPGHVAQFIKKHPGAFAKGVGKAVIPPALALAGGTWLGHNINERRKEKAPETTKTSASAPTRGNFMQASDLPPFKVPSLKAPIEKNSDALPDFVTYGPGDFKKSKYAAQSVERVRRALQGASPERVAEFAKKTRAGAEKHLVKTHEAAKGLRGTRNLTERNQARDVHYQHRQHAGKLQSFHQEAVHQQGRSEGLREGALVAGAIGAGSAGTTGYILGKNEKKKEEDSKTAAPNPITQAATSAKSVGLPTMTPPKGPSIVDVAKPKGPGFGTGISGAFKTTIGGTQGNSQQ